MPTLRRILKYTPAVVMGPLMVAWIASLLVFASCGIAMYGDGEYPCQTYACIERGTPTLGYTYNVRPSWINCAWRPNFEILRRFEFDMVPRWIEVHIAILPLTPAILTLAIGPSISFCFRLWHYLAYTALVAIELAYYLRWQE